MKRFLVAGLAPVALLACGVEPEPEPEIPSSVEVSLGGFDSTSIDQFAFGLATIDGLGLFDNEDLDRDGVLDESEDLNGDGILDPTEDSNANGVLDLSEDQNGNGVLDRTQLDANGDGAVDAEDEIHATGLFIVGADAEDLCSELGDFFFFASDGFFASTLAVKIQVGANVDLQFQGGSTLISSDLTEGLDGASVVLSSFTVNQDGEAAVSARGDTTLTIDSFGDTLRAESVSSLDEEILTGEAIDPPASFQANFVNVARCNNANFITEFVLAVELSTIAPGIDLIDL